MEIRFGRHFDGLHPYPAKTAVGSTTLGPAGLLTTLETQLGLSTPKVAAGEAVLTYLECLREASSSDRFFDASLQVDPVNVARTLLEWREHWYEAGWTGAFADDVPSRLMDIAAVETFAATRVPPCSAQRLQRVTHALADRQVQIERIELHTPLEELPYAWQQLLTALPCVHAPGLELLPQASAGSDLALVQQTLLANLAAEQTTQGERIPLRGDGSLVILRAASRDLSAEAVAEHLNAAGQKLNTLLVADRDGAILDNALERAGLPRCGFRYHTPFRSATQVLKLSLALVWAPIGPHRLLQFLVHPTGLLPRWTRSILAEPISGAPGIGGPAWAKALARVKAAQRDRFEADDDEVERLSAEIVYWLEGERFDPRTGAPLDVLIARTQRVSTWAGAQVHTSGDNAERTLFGAAQAQAEGLVAGLARLLETGATSISRLELERLIDELTTDAHDPFTFSEAGRARATTAPGSVTTASPTVVWWNLSATHASVSYPWSRRELAALRDSGVQLPEVGELLRQRGREWLRPIINATERLVLVVHDDERGEHPVWTQIKNLFDGLQMVDVERALLDGEDAIATLSVPTRALQLRPLPRPRRWWELPTDCVIVRREVESYSSLSKLCDYPHEWVLNYAARLKAGRAVDVADGPLLFGNLAHRLIEDFFNTHDDWRSTSTDALGGWVRERLPDIIEHEGAVLLEPGRGIERQRLNTTLEHALDQLLAHLRSADIAQVQAEARGETAFGGRRLTGSIDLLLTREDGQRAVLDVKWSRQGARRNLLTANRALQLATYAYLQKSLDESELWPHSGFFILTTGNVVARDAWCFPNALVSPSENEEGDAHLWHRLTLTCNWRRAQLDSGRIEIVTDLTEPDDDAQPPEGALAPVKGGDRYDDYTRLTGWETFR